MAIPTLGAMIAAIGSPAEWAAVGTTKLIWDDTNSKLSILGDLTFLAGRKGLVGVYDAAQTQAIWAMGPSYVLTPGGASNAYGAIYGLTWSYNPDYGGAGNNPQSKAGLSHQLLVMHNGVTQTAIGGGIWTNGTVTAPGYTGGVSGSSYGSLTVSGTLSGYAGIYFPYARVVGCMYDSAGNGGAYHEAATTCWHFYWCQDQQCLGIAGSTTTSTFACQINGMAKASYFDASSDVIARANLWSHDGGVHSLSDERLKKNIRPFEKGLLILRKVQSILFNFKSDNKLLLPSDRDVCGISAQELQKILPEAVDIAPKIGGRTTTKVQNPDGSFSDILGPEPDLTDYLSINNVYLRHIMINAIKELDDRLSKIEKEAIP